VGRGEPVERAILLIGAWELVHMPEIPYRATINEAIELGKRFGGTDGHKYVNGVLDWLAKQYAPTRSRPRNRKARNDDTRHLRIRPHRAALHAPAANAVLGVGDDCALVDVTNGMDLAVSTDTMVSGTHFFPTSIPRTSATSRSR
jgi:hypothetical protein